MGAERAPPGVSAMADWTMRPAEKASSVLLCAPKLAAAKSATACSCGTTRHTRRSGEPRFRPWCIPLHGDSITFGACNHTSWELVVLTSSASGTPCAPSPMPFMALTRRCCVLNDDADASGDNNTTVVNTRQNIERILRAREVSLSALASSVRHSATGLSRRCSHARPMRWAAAAIVRPHAPPLIPSPCATRHARAARLHMGGRAPGWGRARGWREGSLSQRV